MGRLRGVMRFDGRLSRLGYWKSSLALVIATAVIWCVTLFVMMRLGGLAAVLFLPLLLIPVAAVALTVRRLHDRDRSAWWLAVFYGVPWAIVWTIGNVRPQGLGMALLFLTLDLASLAISIWTIVELGFRRGSRGPNRFGDEPAVGA